ncbi:MAG: hypothetical protein HQL77_01965 [Magnetococcales bacterium]|nr:hypothetical protein [Magnetococcales bacterium]
MISLDVRMVVTALLVLVTGCSKSDESPEGTQANVIERVEIENQSVFSFLKGLILSYFESVTSSENLFEQEPLAEDILRQEIPPEKLKQYDQERALEKARFLQKSAAAAGLELKGSSQGSGQNIREMGKKFGLSEARIVELEAMAAANAAKKATGSRPDARQSAPSDKTTTPVPANQALERALLKSQSSATNQSMEMQEIVNRRNQRLHEASQVAPAP